MAVWDEVCTEPCETLTCCCFLPAVGAGLVNIIYINNSAVLLDWQSLALHNSDAVGYELELADTETKLNISLSASAHSHVVTDLGGFFHIKLALLLFYLILFFNHFINFIIKYILVSWYIQPAILLFNETRENAKFNSENCNLLHLSLHAHYFVCATL